VDGGRKEVAPLQFRSWVEPKRVRLGEPFLYQLVITHSLAQRYELRIPAAMGPFELLDQSRLRQDAKEAATTTFKLKLALFELGKNTLPDLELQVVEGGEVDRFVAAGMEVEGISSLPADVGDKGASLYDIKPPEEVPIRSYRLIWALLAAAALIAAGYAAVRWIRRPRPIRAAPIPLDPLNRRMLAALDQLRKKDLPSQGRAREFYFDLSEILRAYLGERYGFEALECTSAELMEAAARLQAPGLPRQELAGFVQRSDLVKFAKAEGASSDCEQDLQFGYRLVQQTWTDADRDHLP
jgi:hypothetical protein